MKTTSHILCLSALVLSACTLVEVEQEPIVDNSLVPTQEESVRETKNVTYTGIVQPAGISIYQQGSHRLVLPGGKFILLESTDLDLNGYVGEEVQIFGALRPTVEAGGMIMRVEKIELMNSKDAEHFEESSMSDAMDTMDDASSVSSAVATTSSSAATEENTESSSQDTVSSASSSEQEEGVSDPAVDAGFEERVAVMSRQDYAVGNWNQQYCTSHIGFCAPVHKNWWFKSYGATNSTLWHVEFNSEPIESLHQGPISMDLLPGTIGNKSGKVETVNGKALGYFEWTFGRHFRISGDASLIEPIRYITEHITEYTQ